MVSSLMSYLSTLQPGQLCTDRWDEKETYFGQNADDFHFLPKLTVTAEQMFLKSTVPKSIEDPKFLKDQKGTQF